jgi:hypothetical protein
MDREPLDSIEYESTYFELRPARERLTVTTDGPILARPSATMRVGAGAVASNGRLAATAEIVVAPPGPTTRPGLTLKTVGRSGDKAVHRAGRPTHRPLRVTSGRCPAWHGAT